MEMTSWVVVVLAGMRSLVAKGKPRQCAPTDGFAGDCLNFKLYGWGLFGATCQSCRRSGLRLWNQVDFADATFHFQADCCGSFAVDVVGVFIAVVFQAVSVDRSDATGGMHDHADFGRKADGGLAHTAFNIGVEILLAIAGKIDVHLAGTHVDGESR